MSLDYENGEGVSPDMNVGDNQPTLFETTNQNGIAPPPEDPAPQATPEVAITTTPASVEATPQVRPNHSRRTRLIAVGTGIVAVAGGLFFVTQHSGEKTPTSASQLDADKTDEDIPLIDGNTAPQTANPDYDSVYGIYLVTSSGKFLNPALQRERMGIHTIEATSDQTFEFTMTDKEASDAGKLDAVRQTRVDLLNQFSKVVESSINAMNMNNQFAQETREQSPALTPEQQGYLTDVSVEDLLANPQEGLLMAKAKQGGVLDTNSVNAINQNLPNDAGLRATVCPFGTEQNDICQAAAQQNSEFDPNSSYSITQTLVGEDFRPVYVKGNANTYPARAIGLDLNLGVVWTNAHGDIVQSSSLIFSNLFGEPGGEKGQPDYLPVSTITGEMLAP